MRINNDYETFVSASSIFEEVKPEPKVEKKVKNATVKKEVEVYHEMYY
jgi:hypothetical protein